MENKFNLGDYVRYENEYWYIKSLGIDEYGNQNAELINIKTRIRELVELKKDVRKLSDLEVTFLKYRNIIPKRDLVKGDKFKFVIDKDRECIHGNNLRDMGFNTDNIYTVDNVLNHSGKCISIFGYNFSTLEVRLVEE